MIKAFAMSQDFAAISSATMAALLILVLTELQASSNQVHELRTRLVDEHGAAIKASFDAFYSGNHLPPDQKRRVERQLRRFQTRQISTVFEQFWRVSYGLAAASCFAGLVVVLRWSALAHPSKGYVTALAALSAIGYSSVSLIMGYFIRQSLAGAARRQQRLIALSKLLDVPDAQDAARMFQMWVMSSDGGGWTALNTWHPLEMLRWLQRHSTGNMR
ncbi:hypothetical protein [Streptomyces sp. NPDC001307]|uniref:hypothetical protein n=1 Tax=Streptomyces sp. NPDC001307 TaxID=3364560 RepID=UPI0036779A46